MYRTNESFIIGRWLKNSHARIQRLARRKRPSLLDLEAAVINRTVKGRASCFFFFSSFSFFLFHLNVARVRFDAARSYGRTIF